MDSFQPRKKKSDKAKEKAGRPSTRHVRAYEAMMEKPKSQKSQKPEKK